MRTGRIEFGPAELQELDGLLSLASRVVPMIDVHRGLRDPSAIALRHDVDDNPGALDNALEFGRWEAARGYRSTFFLLHSARYWPDAVDAAIELSARGHEIGIHVNALAESLRTGEPPETILHEALSELRRSGLPIVGAVAHGDELCRNDDGTLRFHNDEIFLECVRPGLPLRPRTVSALGRETTIIPLSLRAFGLEYESNWLPRGDYLSDSGSEWSQPFDSVVRGFRDPPSLHMLVHPDWWGAAFASEGSRK